LKAVRIDAVLGTLPAPLEDRWEVGREVRSEARSEARRFKLVPHF